MSHSVRRGVDYKSTLKRLLIFEKMIFLRKCIKFNLLLNSNRVKGIDLDLLLIQQRRKLFEQLKEMEFQTTDNKMLFLKLNYSEKKSAKKVIFKTKSKYKRRITWLAAKQPKSAKTSNINPKFYPDPKSLKNKKDRQRYLKRRKQKLLTEENKRFNDLILNKSKLELNRFDKQLLCFGNQFIPTPNWDKRVVQKERENLLKHIRALEWKDFFENRDTVENDINYNISCKLNVPKFSRPESNELSKNVKSYIHIIKNKFRNLKNDVILRYKRRNNLNKNHLISLKKLRLKTQNKDIVIGYSDKDGKTIIIDYDDYIKIINDALEKKTT